MKINIDESNKLVITANNTEEYFLIHEWHCSSLRQYIHNYDSDEFVTGIDIDSIIINKDDRK